jgi:hypothetical protein
MIDVTDADPTSIASALHNHVMNDKSQQPHAAGTGTCCSSYGRMGWSLLISHKEITFDWLLLILLEAVS